VVAEPFRWLIRQERLLTSDVRDMEAATPLRKPTVRTAGDRVAVDGLLLDDETTVRLVREREQAGGGTVELIEDAVEIGARVLDREHAAANTDFVKTEFEKVSADVQRSFGEEARAAAEALQATSPRPSSDCSPTDRPARSRTASARSWPR
jgi:hypothetical protein